MKKNYIFPVLFFMFAFVIILHAQTAKSTLDGIQQAYFGEIMASTSYAEYAKAAKNKNVAAMFNAASVAEAIHAKQLSDTAMSLKLTDKPLTATPKPIKTGTDIENLKSGINGETYEFTKMYPAFSKVAFTENQPRTWSLMEKIAVIEKTHANLYTLTLNALNENKSLPSSYYVCTSCGYIEAGNLPGFCPTCSAPSSSFKAFVAK